MQAANNRPYIAIKINSVIRSSERICHADVRNGMRVRFYPANVSAQHAEEAVKNIDIWKVKCTSSESTKSATFLGNC